MRKLLTFIIALFSFTLLSQAQVTVAEWNFGNDDKKAAITNNDSFIANPYTADEGIAANKDVAIISLEGGPAFTEWVSGPSNQVPNSNTWTDGANTKYWLITISTEGYKNLTLSSKQFGSGTGPKDFQLEYSLNGVNWEAVGDAIVVANDWTSGVVANLELPAECADVDALHIRWLNTSTTTVNNGTVADGGTNRIGEIVITGEALNGGGELPSIDNLTVALRTGAVNSDKIELSAIDVDEAHYTVTATALEVLTWVIGSENTPGEGEWFAVQIQPEGVTDITELEYKTGEHQTTWHPLTAADAAEAGVEGEIVWWIDAQVANHNIWLRYAGVEASEVQLTVNVVPFEPVPPTYTLTGKVKAFVEDENGEGEGGKDGDYEYLAGVVVKLGAATTTTDENGAFSFTELDGGNYTLTISHTGFKNYSQEIAVNDDVNLDDIILTPLSTYTVIGKVASAGVYLEGATVKLGTPTATTDENGAYTFNNIVEGTYTITISLVGYVNYSGEVILSDDLANAEGVIELADIELEVYIPKYTIKGVVYSPAGVVAGQIVTLGSESVVTSATGAFSFEDILGGVYTLTITKEFHVDYTAIVNTESAVNEVLNLGNIRLKYSAYPFYETFVGLPIGYLPTEWAVEGLGQTNWRVNSSSAAGGTSPEMYLSWSPVFNGISTLISPEIDPMGNSVLRFQYKFFYSHYSGSQTARVKVAYNNGEWETLKTYTLSANIPATQEEMMLTIPVGTTTMRLAWEFEGNANNINNINIDNIILESPLANDLIGVSIGGNTTPSVGMETPYVVTVLNKGTATQTSYTVKLMTTDGDELATADGVEIASEETKEITLMWTPTAEGPVAVYGEVVLAGDEDLSNNKTGTKTIVVQPEGILTVTIGEGTTVSAVNIPFNFYYKGSLAQTIYYADEFGGNAGAITSIAYTNNFINNLENKAIKIWMGLTDLESMDGGWVDINDLTLVFDGQLDFPNGVNTIIIPLDAPFVYSGGNLVIYTNRVLDSQYHSNQDKFYGNSTANSKRTRYYNSDTSIDPVNPSTGAVTDWYANTMFFFSTGGLGSLTGTVTDGTVPLEGVQVSFVGSSVKTFTNADGEYEFPALLPGTYDMVFSKVGFISHTEEGVEIVADEETIVNVELDPVANFTVTGLVTDINNQAIIGADVVLKGDATFTGVTDADGIFTIEDVFMGTYTLTIKKEGYKTWVENDIAVDATNADDQFVVDLGTFSLIGMMEVIIGEGTNFPPATIPFNFYWKNSLVQTIYYADEINLGAGWLESVVYTNSFVTNALNKEIRVWVGETDKTNMNGGWVDVNSLTLVYEGTQDFPIGVNQIEITFDEPYTYNGGNLVIFTNRVYENAYTSSSDRFFGSEVYNSKRTRFIYSDSEVLDPASPGVGNVNDSHPNTMLMIATDGLGELVGTVADADTEDLIEGALITISGSNAKPITDEDGDFLVKLFPGTYDVTVSKAGYESFTETGVIVVAGDVTPIIIDLVPMSTFTVTGIAKGNDNTLLNGAVATLTGLETLTATAGTDGVFSFSDVLEGTYTLNVTMPGYLPYNNNAVEVNATVAVAGVVSLGEVTLTEIIVAPFGLIAETVNATDVRFSWNNELGFTDDFESYADFIIADIGEYTLYDGDGSPTYGFTGVTFPNSGYVGSYITFNPSAATPALTNEAILPHGGNKFIACFAATNLPNNDWLITPKFPAVSGMKLSFWAKTYMDYGLEKYKIAVSTTDTNVSSFEFITGEISVPVANWTFYEHDLSAYAGQEIHVAIVCVSDDVFVFMVDDLEISVDMGKSNVLSYSVPSLSHYAQAQHQTTRAFLGYKVYLDGNLVTETPITAEEYLFTNLTPGTYTAGVRSVYTSGESDMETLTFTLEEEVPTFIVKGKVKDPQGYLAGVEVKLESKTTTTDTNGAFAFNDVEAGTYTLTIDLDNYELYTQEVKTDNAVNGVVDLGDIELIPVGIMDNALTSLSAYPNPFDGQITITHSDLIERVIITNTLGQRVMDITLNGKSTINTQELGAGTYLITFKGFDGERTVRTLVKQ